MLTIGRPLVSDPCRLRLRDAVMPQWVRGKPMTLRRHRNYLFREWGVHQLAIFPVALCPSGGNAYRWQERFGDATRLRGGRFSLCRWGRV